LTNGTAFDTLLKIQIWHGNCYVQIISAFGMLFAICTFCPDFCPLWHENCEIQIWCHSKI